MTNYLLFYILIIKIILIFCFFQVMQQWTRSDTLIKNIYLQKLQLWLNQTNCNNMFPDGKQVRHYGSIQLELLKSLKLFLHD